MAITVNLQVDERRALLLPRIICLHGGGSNARVFKAQTRAIRAELSNLFRFVFAEAPFPSPPGPDVTSVYKDFGPFRRWLRSSPDQEKVPPALAVEMIEDSIYNAMDEDDLKGGTGEWVGVMGFSQGAKVAASLLFRQQVRAERLGKYLAGTNYNFAILMAGRGPLVSFEPGLLMNSALIDASEIGLARRPDPQDLRKKEHVLRLPTIHVHGIKDPGLALHQHLYREYCSPDAKLIEWDGSHRVPIKSRDVAVLVKQIISMATSTGTRMIL